MTIQAMSTEEPKTAGWPIPPNIKEEFTVFCKRVGTLAKDDYAGALFVWQFLPAQIREWAKLEARGEHAVDETFWAFLQRGMEKAVFGGLMRWLAPITEAVSALNDSEKEAVLGAILRTAGPEFMEKIPAMVRQAAAAAQVIEMPLPANKGRSRRRA